jgi:uncharacterized repeat protein (TIGR03803 family)
MDSRMPYANIVAEIYGRSAGCACHRHILGTSLRTHPMYNKSSQVNRALKLPAQAIRIVLALSLFGGVMVRAQTFTTLASFDGSNGASPSGSLVESPDGNLYGMTNQGLALVSGVVFKFVPGGSLTALYTFCQTTQCPTGGSSAGNTLIVAHSGNLYGTAAGGGINNQGTAFRITANGRFHLIHTFCSQPNCLDGGGASEGLVQTQDGNFYGGTVEFGASGFGTIFKITPTGTFTNVYNLCNLANCADGGSVVIPMMQAANGNLYGSTRYGGAFNLGTIFQLTPSGSLSTLYSFCARSQCTDGVYPTSLVQAANGQLYGMTDPIGLTIGHRRFVAPAVFFKITTEGVFRVLYTGSAEIVGELIQANDGNFYGTGDISGYSAGVIFQMTPAGTLTVLHAFNGTTEGGSPGGGLIQGTDGNLYGTTTGGGVSPTGCPRGPNNCGTIFRLSTGLPAFVKVLVPSAKVGATAVIYGMNLTGATAVRFNGTAASFTQTSATEITATVPAGATTGKIQVVTPSGTRSSNVVFHVTVNGPGG